MVFNATFNNISVISRRWDIKYKVQVIVYTVFLTLLYLFIG
jgi:hypothetical protein